MQMSTKSRYALRLLIDMAINEGEDNVKIKDIAARQNLSPKYLEQIVTVLNKAGYVRSERGPQGGYRMVIKPRDITAGEIVRLFEGSTSPVPCLGVHPMPCANEPVCCTRSLWKRMDDTVNEVLNGTTIQDMVDEAKKEGNPAAINISCPE